jgi:hypothetical protein
MFRVSTVSTFIIWALLGTATAQDAPFGSERFFNHVNVTRYHVGDRILVEDPGSGGTYSPRAEILAVNADGTYKVAVWDKPEAVDHPDVGKVDPFTGKLLKPSAPSSTVKISGNARVAREPWLTRVNEREVTLTHEQIDALNGVVRLEAPYEAGGAKVDPKNDPVLADAIERAKKIAEDILPLSKLVLPLEETARRAALDEVARLQETLITKIYNDNVMSNPLRNEKAAARLDELPTRRPDLLGKVGAFLEAKAGVCVEQAAALQAILFGIGDRGFTIRAMGGRTIENDFGHGFLITRLADGRLYMLDPAWHGQNDGHALDNLDFATFDSRMGSNRRIQWSSQENTRKTAFVDPTSTQATDLSRGYDTGAGETFLATQVRLEAIRTRQSVKTVTQQVLALKQLEGDFSARTVAERARALTFDSASPGLLGGLKGITDSDARNAGDAR